MTQIRSIPPAMVVVAIAMLTFPGGARAGAPTEQLRQYTDQVIRVLEDPALKGEDRRSERRAAVRKAAIEIFDVGETARRALGRHWAARTEAERHEFVDLFADLLERTYIAKIDLFGGERVRFMSEAIDGEHAVVRGRIVTRKGTEIPVEGRLHLKGDRWLLYDVLIENVSLVGNYRAQFDQIIRSASYDELVRRLRDKRSEIADAEAPKPPRPVR
jgi:phospholipid transport system substrate-binding protein